MIKFFHQLSRDEVQSLRDKKLTWAEVAKDYPQPVWCGYPNAVYGIMGCWSLMGLMVTGRNYCRRCAFYIKGHTG